eukprot:712818-Prymnesium_polylepis.1
MAQLSNRQLAMKAHSQKSGRGAVPDPNIRRKTAWTTTKATGGKSITISAGRFFQKTRDSSCEWRAPL